MSSDLTQLQADALAVTAATAPDDVGEILARWLGFMAAVREADRFVRARAVEWIEETGRNIPAGDGTYFYAAHRTEKSARDAGDVLDALLEHTGGDVDAVKACLASQAWKPGACAGVLPAEVFDRLFAVETRTTLKDGGKKPKELVKVDPKFMKGGR